MSAAGLPSWKKIYAQKKLIQTKKTDIMKKAIFIPLLFLCFSLFSQTVITVDNTVVRGTFNTFVHVAANNVTFDKPVFDQCGIIIDKPVKGLRVYGAIAVGSKRLIDLSPVADIPFTGSNYVLQNCSIDKTVMDGGYILFGNQGGSYINKGSIDSISISNTDYNSKTFGPVVQAAGFYHYNIHHNKVIFQGNPTDPNCKECGDYAIFGVSGGNGSIHDNYRSGGWGWLVRAFGAQVKGSPGDITNYNNIDLNTTCYGAIEMRTEIGANNAYTTICNLSAVNNTAGNLKDLKYGNYSNAVVLIPNLAPATICDVRNNVSFNVQTKGFGGLDLGGNVGSFNNFKPTSLSNNIYYATYKDAGFVDDIQCNLVSTSPLIDAGSSSIAVTDISGVTRPQGKAFDIGARELSSGGSPCPVCPPAIICPPPIVCPACPTCLIRTVAKVSQVFDGVKFSYVFLYNDGSTSSLP